MSKQRFKRSSGVVMPIFSLPSPYGIGTFGKEAYNFVNFLKKAGQKYWQILPLGHTGFGNSPYQCFSSVAGNPFFIDLDKLVDMGLLTKESVSKLECGYNQRVNYNQIIETRLPILREAYKNAHFYKGEIEFFARENSSWLDDYALFMALKNHFKDKPVWDWDDEAIKSREEQAMRYYSKMLKEDIDFYTFVQYLFFKQWDELKKYANNMGIQFIGDIPMYPSPDSSDVWASPALFKVDEILRPSGIAGVPPDYYSETGQVWGNPVYNWEAHKKRDYEWWVWRIKYTLKVADIIRIDHFRAFQEYFEIPAGEETAINGKWQPGPRMEVFEAIKKELGDVPIIAEDLGIIDDSVRELLEESGYPGMAVMIFGLRAHEDNLHMPHNWKVNSVGYTSTHDSETFCQSVNELLYYDDKMFALDYINHHTDDSLGFSAIRTAFASPASIAMVMAADLLSLGSEGRINVPSTIGDNWSWRALPGSFTDELAERLRKVTMTYKRL